ncbi:translation initiation factor 4G protein [Dioscorea alata]|uniref:Translation initiation factor 4G protein n=1 Tax=Dioscorea alata TaxID=55571 RepID=A0ACB7UG08_DIOAL|nr:translation initiation factor 4G protein [Dioscorea alata]
MSFNQSRAEKSEGQPRKSGRSGSSGYHRPFSSGGKGGGAAPPPHSSSNTASVSFNRSSKKSGNAPQYRVSPVSVGSDGGAAVANNVADRTAQNGAHAQIPSHGSSDAPSTSAKLVDSSRNSRALPKAPPSQPTAGASDSAAPVTPAKGDASKQYTLQFGTISPGIMNGMQIPARTSSAPPNLDEQKSDQARHDPFWAMPTLPLPAAPKQQQQTRKDVGARRQSNLGEAYSQTQTKKEAHVQNPPAVNMALPKPSVLPVSGPPMPVSMPFQQPHVSLQFGGPGIQLQSQGVTAASLQMPLTFPVGGAPQVPQQMFVSALQSHPMQAQAIMHQGQGFGFAPQVGHQLPSQLGNLGIAIGPQFGQQQPGKFGGQRKATVKITHPDTHEELRLDQRTDSVIDGGSSRQRPISNLTSQSQPLPTYAHPHQMNYYAPLQSNTYGPPIVYPAAPSVPMPSGPMSTHAPRHSYTVGPSGQPVSYMSPPILNPVTGIKTGPPLHGVHESVKSEVSSFSAPSSSVPVSIKPLIGSHADKIGTSSVMITAPVSDSEAHNVAKLSLLVTDSHQRKGSEIRLESNLPQSVSVSEPSISKSLSAAPSDAISPQRTEHESVSAAPVSLAGDAVGAEGRKKEPITRSNSLKEHQKKPSKKDPKHMQPQQRQQDSLKSAEVTKSSSNKNSSTPDIPSQPESGSCDNELKSTGAVEHETVPASSIPAEAVLEKDTSVMIGIPSMKRDSVETSISVALHDDRIPMQNSDSTHSQPEPNLVTVGPKSEPQVYEKNESSNDLLQDDISDAKVNLVTTTARSVEPFTSVKKDVAGTEDSDKSASGLLDNAEKEQLEACLEDVSSCVEVDKNTEKADSCVAASDDTSVKSDSLSHLSHTNASVDKILPTDCVTNASESTSDGDFVTSDSAVPLEETIIGQTTASSGTVPNQEGKAADLPSGNPVSVTHSGPKDKLLEPTRAKTPSGKKKLREILSKADSAGSSDLYNAYKSPQEKHEPSDLSESKGISTTVDTKSMSVNDLNKEAVVNAEDKVSKAEVDDWEDAADISTLKLGNAESNHRAHGAKKQPDEYGNEATGRKKYSRDFLMTFSEQCTELPADFEIGYGIANALMSGPVSASYAVDREPHPSPGRSTDRSPRAPWVDRRIVVGDDDKWTKFPGSSGPVLDPRLDLAHGISAVSFRPGQGVNHGVLRNPRGQLSSQYAGGILSGPMASPGGVPQNGIDADRWHRAPSAQRGLVPSLQTPSQVMHKATRKYEVGKVSDVEEAKQRQLKSILNKLTPQNFEKLFTQVKTVNIDNPVTLTGVISQIFDKALTEPTFCEMYADFCFHLSSELPDFSENNVKITFKRLLLNKCQEEFERGEREQAEADKAEEEGEIEQSEGEREEKRIKARRRMLGNIRLIGELYKKKMLTERIMHECIKKLLGQYPNPDEEDIEALCKLMSTIGQMIDHQKAKEHMDAYFEMMLNLSTNPKLSSRLRFMLKDAIDLRKNRWQQRRKIEGPKKIEEVHRDVAHERQAQASRLARGPVISSTPRRGAAVDFGPRGSTILSSPPQQMGGSRVFPVQARGPQDVRMEDRHPFESKTFSSPLPQRSTDDDSITLGPKGGLGRGMSFRGQPLTSNASLSTEFFSSAGDPRRMTAGPNGYSSAPQNSRDEVRSRDVFDRLGGTSYEQPTIQRTYSGNRDSPITDHAADKSSVTSSTGRIQGSVLADPTTSSLTKPLCEDGLRDKSMSAIREYYSAKDYEEVVLCIKELNSPNFFPTMISLWITDSFERKDMERDLLATLLVKLNQSRDDLLSETQLIQGFENVLSSLEDAINDAPKAAEFLGRLFARVILDTTMPLKEIGRLILEGGEEPGQLLESGVASETLGSILEFIQKEKGDSVLNELRANSGLHLESFRPPHPLRARKLDPFL